MVRFHVPVPIKIYASNIMHDHYIDFYKHHSKSIKTNKLVDEVADNLKPTRAEYLKLARLAQDLEIRLLEAEKRVSDHQWEKSPGQGMQPQSYWDEANSPSYGWR